MDTIVYSMIDEHINLANKIIVLMEEILTEISIEDKSKV